MNLDLETESQKRTGTTATSSPAVDPFESQVAEISAEAPDALKGASTPGDGAASGVSEDLSAAPVIEETLVSRATVKKYIGIPFNVLSSAFKKPDLKLLDYEEEMFTPAVTDCINKYVPEWLKRTDRPELVLFGTCIVAYLLRVGLIEWAKQLWERARGIRKKPTTTAEAVRERIIATGNKDLLRDFDQMAGTMEETGSFTPQGVITPPSPEGSSVI